MEEIIQVQSNNAKKNSGEIIVPKASIKSDMRTQHLEGCHLRLALLALTGLHRTIVKS